MILETLLYQPVKAFLEGLGFAVKGEIGGCDLFALRGDDPPFVVIGELNLTFNLAGCRPRRRMRRSLARCSPFVAREGTRKRREVSQPLPKAGFRVARSAVEWRG